MSLVFNWPQYVWLALAGITLLANIYCASVQHQSTTNYSFGNVVGCAVSIGVSFWLLFVGGFFAGCR